MLIGVIVMLIVSMVSLVILSALTYFYKWQAYQAQVGITLTYIISGFLGGFLSCMIGEHSREKRNLLICGMILGTIYLAVLLAVSVLIAANEAWDIVQIILIWLLLSASSALGIFTGDSAYRIKVHIYRSVIKFASAKGLYMCPFKARKRGPKKIGRGSKP